MRATDRKKVVKKNIIIFGAGKSSSVLIKYLLYNKYFKLTIIDSNLKLAKEKIGDYKNGKAINIDINNINKIGDLINKNDLIISLLPPNLHHIIALHCVNLYKPFLCASYVSDEMNKLHDIAVMNGVPLIMESGLDPGIDHMSAMQEIDMIQNNGGKITSFKSYCGGLVAPESDNNPWNYKISWNPKNILTAGFGGAKYIENKENKIIPYHKLFNRIDNVICEDIKYEAYLNRDSTKYLDVYFLPYIKTFLRGTLRKPGFCKAWDSLIQLGLTNDDTIIEVKTKKEFLLIFLKEKELSITKLSEYLNISTTSDVIDKFKYLGLFSDDELNVKKGTPSQILQSIIEDKLSMTESDKDLIVMKHEFEYVIDNKLSKSETFLMCTGDNSIETAMAKTVGLPLGIVAELILLGELKLKGGVQIPIKKEIYIPVLKKLEEYGIVFKSKIL